jgi:hypothetical protein
MKLTRFRALFVVNRVVDCFAGVLDISSNTFNRLAGGQKKAGNQHDAQYAHGNLLNRPAAVHE